MTAALLIIFLILDLIAGYVGTWWWNMRTLRRIEAEQRRVLHRIGADREGAGARIRP